MKKCVTVMGLLIVCSSLISCSTYTIQHKSSKLPSRHQLCTQLRHEIIFRPPLAVNMTTNTPIQQAQAIKEYNRYDCEEKSANPSVLGVVP